MGYEISVSCFSFCGQQHPGLTGNFIIFIPMKKKIGLVLLLSVLLGTSVAQTPAQRIPDFRFIRKTGAAFTRQHLTPGKPIFFVFFDITCDHCRMSLQYLNSHYRELGRAALYLVTMDPGPSAEAFLATVAPQLAKQPNALLLRDTRQQFITLFQPRKFPSLFLYSSRQQLILYSDEEKDLPVFLAKIRSAN